MKKLEKAEESVYEIKNIETITTKPGPKKLTKEDRENDVISEFENDCNDIFETRKNCGLDLSEIKCKTCSFDTHSEGLMRKHKRTAHRIKETNQNIILGFKNDMFHHLKLLEDLGELNKITCAACNYKTNSKG